MATKLQKTSLQLSPTVLHDMDSWPGLTRSEALRLSVERGHYLSTLRAEAVAALADDYGPILREALGDMGYEDYKLAARSLPAIVIGFLSEENRCWKSEIDGHQLNEQQLVEKLNALPPLERIGILDCTVAERHRKTAAKVSRDARNQSRRTHCD